MSKKIIIINIISIQILICFLLILNIYKKNNTGISTKIESTQIKTKIENYSLLELEEKEKNYIHNILEPNTKLTEFHPSLKEFTKMTNNDGLNDSLNYNVEKKPNTFRIITLGDSFTAGYSLPLEQNWTEFLEKKLNEKKICKNIDTFEIINFGKSGADPLYEVLFYKRRGIKYNPDLIIWMLIDNDRFGELQTSDIDNCINSKKYTLDYCYENNRKEFRQKYSQTQINEMQMKNINALTLLYDKNIFIIDYYNTHSQMIISNNKNTVYNQISNELSNYDYFDVYLKDNGHPNKKGHQIISDIIYEKLFSLNQIPCQPIN